MSSVHPFVNRIRTERTIVDLINRRSGYFGSELIGFSREAIEAWFCRMPEPVRSNEKVQGIKDKLEYIGKVTKLASSGSHKGAMIALPTNEEIVGQLLIEITDVMRQVPSSHQLIAVW